MLEHAWGRRAERVLSFVERLLDELAVPDFHRELLGVHVGQLRAQASAQPDLPALQLPLLTYAAVAGGEEPAVPLAAACALLYLGADLLDNVVDDELPARWHGRADGEATLAGATLVAALPHLALDRVEPALGTPQRIADIRRLMAHSLLTMSAGQLGDLRSSARDPASAIAVAERKGGAEFELFAQAGARLATDDRRTVDAYGAFGQALGAGGQIASDVGDLYRRPSRDLLNGKRTLPVVHALTRLDHRERGRLERLLESGDATKQDQIRAAVERAGSLVFSALVVETYRRRALASLRAAAPRAPAGAQLGRLADWMSLLEQRDAAA
jgi:geranylgeranyl pyrophosphate synthase